MREHRAPLAVVIVLVSAYGACGDDSTTNDRTDAGGSNSLVDASDLGDAEGPDTGGGSGSGGGSGVACGNTMTCATGMECCVTFGGGGSGGSGATPTYNCIASGGNCQGISQECDGPEDCVTGEQCCGGVGGGDVRCDSGGGQCIELCHTPADCSTAGHMCCTSMFFGQYCAAMCF